MSPRAADPDLRDAVVVTAARLLAEGGRAALTTRRLAAELGTSTMTIYTRFGSLDEVHQAVRVHGFAQLCGALEAIRQTEDPVADLTAVGVAYVRFALSEAELYRAMFLDRPPGLDDAGARAFEQVVASVRRCVDAGRFESAEHALLLQWAAEIWIAAHGIATLAIAQIQPADRLMLLLSDMTFRLAVGFGDTVDTARRSTAGTSHGVGRLDSGW